MSAQYRLYRLHQMRLPWAPRLSQWILTLLALALFAAPIVFCVQRNGLIHVPAIYAWDHVPTEPGHGP